MPGPSRGHEGLSRRAVILGAAATAGCATTRPRLAPRPARPGDSDVIDLNLVRFPGDLDREGLMARMPADAWRRGVKILALSSGAEDGAYGAGILNGWSARGDRPRFDVVTGVSTGAFMAPFAFLGEAEDATLRGIYTRYDVDDIAENRGLRGLLGEALFDTAPLAKLMAHYLTTAVVDAVAREHAIGRRLFIVTTNLDQDKATIWDLGALASLDHPKRLELFRAAILASGSVPGVFPPVLIEGLDGDRRVQELHTDGGTVMQFLAIPERVILEGALATETDRRPELFILINNRLDGTATTVDTDAITVAERSFSTLIRSNARASLLSAVAFARESGGRLSFTAVGPDFVMPLSRRFDRDYMAALFDYGQQRVLAGEAWKTAV
ncbi:MAG: patatin-like phospholipase family protein [Pseudomonadota bacterium]